MIIFKFLSDADKRERAQLEVLSRGINSHDLLKHELRIERMIAAGLSELENLISNIMNRDEAVALLGSINTTLTAVNDEIAKVSAETQTLQKNIANLTDKLNNATIPDDVVAALKNVQASAARVQLGVQAVDDLVPDATPTPAPTEAAPAAAAPANAGSETGTTEATS